MHVQDDVLFILASASLRRQEILSISGLDFTIATPDIDESEFQNENVCILTEQLALEKAKKVSSKFQLPHVVISADTLIKMDMYTFGKPQNIPEAMDMLLRLSGRSHEVITGLCVLCKHKNLVLTRSATTKVYFKSFNKDTADAYVRQNDPIDWAGSYAIQGPASMLVQKIEGDYFNVVGLPLSLLYDMMLEIGYDLLRNQWISGI